MTRAGGFAWGSVQLGPVEQHLVVRALDDIQILALAPRQRLLMQRDVRGVGQQDLVGVVDHLVALVDIRLDNDLLGQFVDFRIAVAAQIEGAALAGLVAAGRQADEDIPRIERPGRPAEKRDREAGR